MKKLKFTVFCLGCLPMWVVCSPIFRYCLEVESSSVSGTIIVAFQNNGVNKKDTIAYGLGKATYTRPIAYPAYGTIVNPMFPEQEQPVFLAVDTISIVIDKTMRQKVRTQWQLKFQQLVRTDSIRKTYWSAYTEMNIKKDSVGLLQLGIIWDSLRKEDSRNYRAYLLENPSTDMSLFALERYAYFLYDPVIIKQALNALPSWAKRTSIFESIARKIDVGKLKVGQKTPSFVLANTAGKLVRDDLYRGKILLIDFWASWCGPCRKQNVFFKNLHEEYQRFGFEIVSISIDENPDAWRKAVSTDKMNWMNVRDLGGFLGVTPIDYGVLSIPASYLIDRNGLVVAINTKEQELKSIVEALLKNGK